MHQLAHFQSHIHQKHHFLLSGPSVTQDCLDRQTKIRHLLQRDNQKDELVALIISQLHLKKASHHLELGDTGITPNLSSTGG